LTTTYVKADERRRQLVTAARHVLERQGVAGTTLRAVAAEAGVPLGTVHYIFPSKQDLFRAVLEDVVRQISNAVRSSAGTAADLESAIRESVLEVWSRLTETDAGQHVMQYELTIWALRTPGMADLAAWQYQYYLDQIAGTWTRAAARLGATLATPAEDLARLFLAGLDGLILQYLTLGDAERVKSDLEALVRQMLRAATTEPTATA
jgi:AcrR family transcriptional regulator